jgi:hypothetical protein
MGIVGHAASRRGIGRETLDHLFIDDIVFIGLQATGTGILGQTVAIKGASEHRSSRASERRMNRCTG